EGGGALRRNRLRQRAPGSLGQRLGFLARSLGAREQSLDPPWRRPSRYTPLPLPPLHGSPGRAEQRIPNGMPGEAADSTDECDDLQRQGVEKGDQAADEREGNESAGRDI